MQPLFLVFGLIAVFVGGLLEFYGGPEVHGAGNWFMMIFGVVCVAGGLGTIPHDKPQPAPTEKKQPEPGVDEIEAAYQLGKEAEYLWLSGKDPRSHIKAAAQLRAYGYKNRPDLADAFLSGTKDKFQRAILIGAKIITEHERS